MTSKSVLQWGALVLAPLVLAGCEGWTGGNSVDSWNNRYNAVDFSGVYRSASSGPLVSDYTQMAAQPGTAATTNLVANEQIGTAVEGQSSYSGNLAHGSVVPNSVQIIAGVFSLTDNGTGALAGGGKSGLVTYGTGNWSINLAGEWPTAGDPITATYQYVVPGTASNAVPPAQPGSSGIIVYSFVVTQEGEGFTIVDNNGSTYTGQIGSVRTADGTDISTGGASSNLLDIAVTAQFTAHGYSAAGLEVNMTGTMERNPGTPVLTGSTNTTLIISRSYTMTMQGTWVETNGKVGNIYGVRQ